MLLFLAVPIIIGCSKKREEKPDSLNIFGTIQIDPALKKYTKESDVIFLIAKPASGGPPVAVIRFTGKNYPYSFNLTNQNLMISETVLDAPLNLSVRVDKDGEASTKNSGDLIGTCEKNPVSIQSENVILTIQEAIP